MEIIQMFPMRGKMLGNKNDVSVDGSGNQTNVANGPQTINNINQNLPNIVTTKPSNIQRLLEGISDLVAQEEIEISDLDLIPYNIEKKIDFNDLNNYRDYVDIYKENYYIVCARIKDLKLNGFISIEQAIFKYVQKKFMKLSNLNTADLLIEEIVSEIKQDLICNLGAMLNHEDLEYISDIVFYVFSKCKIFKKPL